MKNDSNDIIGISCSVFKYEIKHLIAAGSIQIPFFFRDSMLHLRPGHLETKLNKAIERFSGKKIVLVYGDCQPNMHRCELLTNVSRVEGINCNEILLGKKIYRKFRSERAFFLLPEWTLRWQEIFKKQLGFTQDIAAEFMNEMHSKLIYLDTGVLSVPETALNDIAMFCRLPYEVEITNLDHLVQEINQASQRFVHEK